MKSTPTWKNQTFFNPLIVIKCEKTVKDAGQRWRLNPQRVSLMKKKTSLNDNFQSINQSHRSSVSLSVTFALKVNTDEEGQRWLLLLLLSQLWFMALPNCVQMQAAVFSLVAGEARRSEARLQEWSSSVWMMNKKTVSQEPLRCSVPLNCHLHLKQTNW